MPVQTQCRPFQHQCSVAVGNQHQKVMGIPLSSSSSPAWGKAIPPWGFFWVVEVELWVVAQCVCKAWRGGMFTKGWLQSCLTEEVSVPMSTPAPENRVLLSGRNLGWFSLLGVTPNSPFPLTLMRWHWPVTGSSWCPSLEGTIQSAPVGWYLRWADLWESSCLLG